MQTQNTPSQNIDTPDTQADSPFFPAEIQADQEIHADIDLSKFAQKRKSSESVQTPKNLSDRYEFIREIGKGSQGTVYLAKQKSTQNELAIKELRIDSVQTWKEYELFHREAEVLRSLNIEGVAHFYEAPEYLSADPPCAYIVQEYIPGKSIEDMIKNGYRFSITQIFKVTLELIDILEKLHTHQPPVIHRDLKPGNIIIKPVENGQLIPYIIDFGAVANPQVQTGGSTIAGTYGYMPPEQLMGRPLPASDIYALGATVAALLSGVPPSDMQTQDYRLIFEPYLENIPNFVIATLRQMLEPDIKKRLTDYTELKTRFGAFYKNNFNAASSLGSSIFNMDELNERLQTVKTLGQRGNLDLWISLPNETPRAIPPVYKNLQKQLMVPERSSDLSANDSKHHEEYKKWLNSSTGFTYHDSQTHLIPKRIQQAISLMGSSLMLILCAFLFSTDNTGLFIVMILFGILFMIAGILKGPLHKHIENLNINLNLLFKRCSQKYDARHTTALNNALNDYIYEQKYLTLLEKGTKTIATIIDITYEPADQLLIKQYEIPDLKRTKYLQLGYYYSVPSFKIKYRFNPPDDNNPEDLIHEVTVHKDYSSILEPGDPLPILYYISPENNLEVYSMPFPFPLNDAYLYKDLYYSPDK